MSNLRMAYLLESLLWDKRTKIEEVVLLSSSSENYADMIKRIGLIKNDCSAVQWSNLRYFFLLNLPPDFLQSSKSEYNWGI